MIELKTLNCISVWQARYSLAKSIQYHISSDIKEVNAINDRLCFKNVALERIVKEIKRIRKISRMIVADCSVIIEDISNEYKNKICDIFFIADRHNPLYDPNTFYCDLKNENIISMYMYSFLDECAHEFFRSDEHPIARLYDIKNPPKESIEECKEFIQNKIYNSKSPYASNLQTLYLGSIRL